MKRGRPRMVGTNVRADWQGLLSLLARRNVREDLECGTEDKRHLLTLGVVLPHPRPVLATAAAAVLQLPAACCTSLVLVRVV